jgi:hypothetical protein
VLGSRARIGGRIRGGECSKEAAFVDSLSELAWVVVS